MSTIRPVRFRSRELVCMESVENLSREPITVRGAAGVFRTGCRPLLCGVCNANGPPPTTLVAQIAAAAT